MKKYFTHKRNLVQYIIAALLLALSPLALVGQTTLSTTVYPNNNGSGTVTFNLENTNTYGILISDLEGIVSTSGLTTAEFYYNPVPVNGSPGAISAANGWTLIATGTFNGTGNTTTSTTEPFLTGLSFVVPAGTTYGIAVTAYSGTSARQRYSGTAAAPPTPTTISVGGVNFHTGPNIGYGGGIPPTAPTNTPRGWIGKITFSPLLPCVDPPTAGNATATNLVVCANEPSVLNLSGNSIGMGQTYQWQSSATSSGPWTNISGALNASAFTITPASTLHYRAAVTCGATTNHSTPVEVVVNPIFPSGIYTINSALPTGGTNYQTFADAVSAVLCGIAGPVTFNVDPLSGPYTEQITIPEIASTSATNTITFNGNGRTIQFAPTAADRHIVKLDGADHITLNDLTIISTDPTYGWGISLTNGADNNIISNNIIDISAVTSTTQSNSAGIVTSGSTTSVLTNGNNANNLTVTGNTIIGAYQGMSIYGNSTSVENHLIENNMIQDFYATGILLSNNNGTLILNNNIHRANRSSVTTFAGVQLSSGNTNVTIDGNRIHDTHNSATTQSGAAYGIYFTGSDATTGNENLVKNNLIYNFNSLTGTQYGLYNSSSDGAFYYHNTVVLDEQTSTSGTTYAFYQTTLATNIHLRNNIFYVTREGSGLKNAMRFNTTTSTISSNNNALYVSSPSGTTGIGYYGANFVTLANWQTANGGIYDQNSVEADPLFVNPSAGNFKPTSPAIDNIGTPVGVIEDILGLTRSLTVPDPGAYEFVPPTNDGGVLAFNSPVAPFTAGLQSITVAVQNFGINVINSFNVNWTVNGVLQTPFAAVATIPIGGTATVTIGTFNFAPGSMFDVVAWTSDVNGNIPSTDPNPGNDTAMAQFCVGISGVFTLDKNLPSSATNFISFADIVHTLSTCGINGAVTINVTAGSGPYNEQIILGEIPGSSATSRVTFNGNGETISYSSANIAERAIFKLNGTDHVTINNFVLDPSAGTYGYGVHLMNGADHNEILNNTITNPLTSTSANYSGIVASGSPTSATVAGNSGNNNLIENNTITGGYYGVILYGNGSTSQITGNQIKNNTITDPYFYGIYLQGNTGTLVSGNDISRPNRTSISTFYGIYLITFNSNILVDKNQIHNTADALPSNTSANYGIYVSGSTAFGDENIVVQNNLIYNFNNNGSIYGMYNTAGANTRYYHNTVSFDHGSAMQTGGTYGLFVNTADTVSFVNNIISITRGSGGVTENAAIKLNNTGALVTSNYNDLYVNTPNGNNFVGVYGTVGHLTLGAPGWQTTGLDLNSVAVEPVFSDIASNNYTPNNYLLDNAGTPVGVLEDIFNTSRSLTTPDPGAIEFMVAANDVATVAILTPNNNDCGDSSAAVTVVVRNFGSQTQNNIPVTVNASGAITATISNTVATLAPLQIDTITVGTINTYNGGTIDLTAIVQNPGDSNFNNDSTLRSITIRAIPPAPMGINDTVCIGETAYLMASDTAWAYDWYDAPVGGNLLHTGDTLVIPNLTVTSTYYVTASTQASNALLITEADLGNTDAMEIQNVSSQPLDVTGWKVLISNDYGNINSVNSNIQTLSGLMQPGERKYWTDNSTDNYWGSNMLWNPGAFPTFSGWAMILNSNNEVVDFVAWGWPSSNIQGMNITVGGSPVTIGQQWSGNGVDATNATTGLSISRQGNMDVNTSADWAIIGSSISSTNPGLILPFSGGGGNNNGCEGPRTTVIAVLSQPVADAGADDDVCLNSSINIGGTNTASGFGPFTYSWTPVSSLNSSTIANPDASPSTFTSYTVTIMDKFGCTASDNINISVLSIPSVSINPQSSFCIAEAPRQLTAIPAGGMWSGDGIVNSAAGIFDPSVAGLGLHNIVYAYVGSNGCTGYDTITLEVKLSPDATISGPATLCINDANVQYSAPFSGGTWIGNGIVNSVTGVFNPSIAGLGIHMIVYDVNITGCADKDTFYVTVHNISNAAITPVSPMCADAMPVQLSAMTSGGTWAGNGVSTGGLFNPVIAGPGQHLITHTVSNSNGCQSSANTTVTVYAIPTFTINAAGPYCVNGSGVALSASVQGGYWSGAGIVNSFAGIFNPATAGVGTHTISYTVANGNGCTKTETTTVTVNASPVAQIDPVGVLCANSPVLQLTAVTSGGTWSGNGINASGLFDPTNAGPGMHIISYTVSNANGCTSTGTTTVNVTAPLTVSANVINESCSGDNNGSIVLNVTGGTAAYIYNWSNGGTSKNIYDLAPGNYTVTVEDQYGCESATSYTISSGTIISVSIDSIVNATSPSTSNGAIYLSVTSGTAPYSYTWSTGATTQDLTGVRPDTYEVTIRDANGCTGTFTYVVDSDFGIGIAPLDREISFTIYPVPASDYVTIDLRSVLAGDVLIELIDPLGRIVFKETIYISKEYKKIYDTRDLPSGSYHFRISGNVMNVTKPFVLVK